MDKRKTELVVKSNRMIEASYRLNLVEQQIILFAICRSREEQKGFSAEAPITITASAFAAQFGTNAKLVYSQLKEAIDTLYDRSITIHEIDPVTGGEMVTETRWISDKSYIDGHGQIKLTFAPRVIPFITRLGEDCEFTTYRLEKIGAMSSAHAVRLYELLVQYLSIGKREVEIAWLKETLQLTGEYKAIKDFKRRVIDLAMTQINEHSDINVSYTQRKKGASVTHFIFDIKAKVDKTIKKINNNPTIDKEYIDRHARPGETYDQAYRRLNNNDGQKNINIYPINGVKFPIPDSQTNHINMPTQEEVLNIKLDADTNNKQEINPVMEEKCIAIDPQKNNISLHPQEKVSKFVDSVIESNPNDPIVNEQSNMPSMDTTIQLIINEPDQGNIRTRPWWKFWK